MAVRFFSFFLVFLSRRILLRLGLCAILHSGYAASVSGQSPAVQFSWKTGFRQIFPWKENAS